MGRPLSINLAVGRFAAITMKRLLERQQRDPDFIPTEGQARVVKILAEAQAILQKRKPEDEEQEEEPGKGGRMTLGQLEEMTADKPEQPPVEGEDAGS